MLYIGVTQDLNKRLYQHKNPIESSRSFTSRYNCFYLLYYERFSQVEEAIQREKQLKSWSRVKKERLITNFNKDWRFLNDAI